MMRSRLLVALVIGGLLLLSLSGGSTPPVMVAYATSDSMEPTIGVGDGYLVIPATDIRPGDVVTFYSNEREEYVTHRVVDTHAGGFITKGDANLATDQATGHPAVPRTAITGKVLALGGQPLVVPGLGILVESVRGYGIPFFLAIVGAFFAVTWLRGGNLRRLRARRRPQERHVLHVFVVAAFLVLTGVILASTSVVHVTYTVVEEPTAEKRVLAADEASIRTITLDGVSSPASYAVIEMDGVRLLEVDRHESGIDLTVEIPPSHPPTVTKTIRIYHYPMVLPRSVILTLHALRPELAAGCLAAVIVLPVYVGYLCLADGKAPIRTRVRAVRRHLEAR